MGDKSEQKRSYILEAARKVFMEKGFRSVTMQDIVEACEISRGGLYLYFNNTEEVFAALLKLEQKPGRQEEADALAEEISAEATAADVLALFLKEQKKEIMRKKNSLAVAIYEYYFQSRMPKKENVLKQQFDAGVLILENLIREGIRTGEFYCEDPRGTAGNIMYVLEGLKMAARTIGISEAAVDKELVFMMQGLVFE